ncbi:MAG: four helix bundle protein [Myxococcales bacterium]|nr:four helix bundle protein [Myxococcales bacterium]
MFRGRGRDHQGDSRDLRSLRPLQLLRSLVPVLKALATQDPELTKQLRRAAQSVGQNLSEGNQRAGKDRRHLFRIALGSAAEVTTALQQAVALESLAAAQVAEALELADRIRAPPRPPPPTPPTDRRSDPDADRPDPTR